MPPDSVSFEPAGSGFVYGTYLGLRVLIMARNGYMNGTKLAKEEGKEISNWRQNDTTDELIRTFEATYKKTALLTISTGENEYRGTYVHPRLIGAVGHWCSPAFHLKVLEILEEYNERENRKAIQERDDRIANLERKLDEIIQLGKIQSRDTKEMSAEMKEVKEELQGVKEQNDEISEQLDEMTRKLDVAVEDRVPKPTDLGKTSTLVVVKKSETGFYVLRRQKCTIEAAIARYQRNHPGCSIGKRIDYNPNAVNLFERIRVKLRKIKKARICGNDVTLQGLSEREFYALIDDIDEERRDVEGEEA